MTQDKSKTATVLSSKVKRPTPLSLRERVRKALTYMLAEGFDTFICPIEQSVGRTVAELVVRLKMNNPQIKLVVVFEYYRNELFAQSLVEQNSYICNKADDILYAAYECVRGIPSSIEEYVIVRSSAVILYQREPSLEENYILEEALRECRTVLRISAHDGGRSTSSPR
ncbi:MAG: hypothetical protein SNI58_01180 [Rikenellaceae bacterium]